MNPRIVSIGRDVVDRVLNTTVATCTSYANADSIAERLRGYDDQRETIKELCEALRRFRANVDVSTIRPGKRTEARWAELVGDADDVLSRVRL